MPTSRCAPPGARPSIWWGDTWGRCAVALFAAKKHKGSVRSYAEVEAGGADWIAPDEALPEHPSVLWRKRYFPKQSPRYKVSSILSVMELVALGLGVGVVPLFLAQGRSDLVQLTEAIDECQTELWLLTHVESRHLRRVSTVYWAPGRKHRPALKINKVRAIAADPTAR